MAVQAQHFLNPAFLPHDIGQAFRALEIAAVHVGGGSVFLDELGFGGCTPAPAPIRDAAFGDTQPHSELTCSGGGGGDNNVFLPRKRARVAAPGFLDDGHQQQGLVLPLPLPQVFGGDMQSRAGGCGAASTTGRAVTVNGVLSQLYCQGVEIDSLVRLETERMRAGLAAVERAAACRLRAAEAELERARCRHAELEERFMHLAAEGQAWMGVARSHEAVVDGLRATLDQVLQRQHPAAGTTGDGGVEAEDARSCCFETSLSDVVPDDDAACRGSSPSCKSCGGGDACMLLLPCQRGKLERQPLASVFVGVPV